MYSEISKFTIYTDENFVATTILRRRKDEEVILVYIVNMLQDVILKT